MHTLFGHKIQFIKQNRNNIKHPSFNYFTYPIYQYIHLHNNLIQSGFILTTSKNPNHHKIRTKNHIPNLNIDINILHYYHNNLYSTIIIISYNVLYIIKTL